MTQRQKGQTLIELLASISIMGIFALVGISAVTRAHRRVALAAATAELRVIFQQTRMTAVTRNRNVAIRFRPQGDRWNWTVYEDGDGDGVRNDDIAAGIDAQIQRPRIFHHMPARIGVPAAAIPDPVTGQSLALRLPVRFGNSMLCSFSRSGESSNGSIVLTDGKSVHVIRVDGRSALIFVMRWDGWKWRSQA